MIDPTAVIASHQARVLVVDDEAPVRQALARSLTLLGYRADAAASGYQALGMLEHTRYDAMVLDIRMPGMDGIQVMQHACRMYPDLSIILLTGHATLESAISAVRAQAADYLLKPAKVYAVAAAIERALQRRIQEDLAQTPAPANILQAGPITLDREMNVVSVAEASGAGDREVELTASESALLVHLMLHPDRVLSCRELASAALGYDVRGIEAQSIIRPHISRLRKKIEPNPDYPPLIRTVPGKGYLFSP